MKRLVIAILSVLFMLSLCSCSSSGAGASSAYTVDKYGTSYVVDPEKGTISDGTYIFQYTITGRSNGYEINITYPDGSTYWWSARTSGSVMTGSGGWSDDYDESRYVDGRTLCDVLEEDIPKEKDSKNVLLIFLLFIVGIFNTAAPRAAWYLEYGWRYKNAEPSDLAIGLNRFGGVAALIAAVVMILI